MTPPNGPLTTAAAAAQGGTSYEGSDLQGEHSGELALPDGAGLPAWAEAAGRWAGGYSRHAGSQAPDGSPAPDPLDVARPGSQRADYPDRPPLDEGGRSRTGVPGALDAGVRAAATRRLRCTPAPHAHQRQADPGHMRRKRPSQGHHKRHGSIPGMDN